RGVGTAPPGPLGVDGRAQVAEHGVRAALRLGLVQFGLPLEGRLLGHLSGPLRDLRRLLPHPVHQPHQAPPTSCTWETRLTPLPPPAFSLDMAHESCSYTACHIG